MDVEVLRVLADNPSTIDLLGLAPIAAAVGDVVCSDNSEPVTVGLHGPWGSGKSSLLQQVLADLEGRDRTVVIELNPWEFDDQDDVKGTIIASVLSTLAEGADDGIKAKLFGLIRRISWSRATTAVARGALTMAWDINQLVDAFTPQPEDGPPRSLVGFRDEFEAVMNELPVDRVVVLVDDLDRCLPRAVLSTLEAVKLFLAVPKMAFVVAADQAMVREAIASGLGETRRSALFARDYLDKIVQVPIGVPQPTDHDAECYVALLLAQRSNGDALDLGALSNHADNRRSQGATPYLAGAPGDYFSPDDLHEAKLIVSGLGTDDVVNPRRMKRFVNALAVRQHTARASGIDLEADVVAKLFMLEHRFADQMTELAGLAKQKREELLGSWEAWAQGDNDAGVSPGEPEGPLRTFFGIAPFLAGRDTDKYFVLARKLTNTRFAGVLGEDAQQCLQELVSGDMQVSEAAAARLTTLPKDQAEAVVAEMVGQLSTAPQPANLMRGLLRAAEHEISVSAAIGAIKSRKSDIDPGTAAVMGQLKQPSLAGLLSELKVDPAVSEITRNTLGRTSS